MSTYELEYFPEPSEVSEAMKLATKVVFKGPKKVLIWLQAVVLILLIPAGFLGVILLTKLILTGSAAFSHPFWYVFVLFAGGLVGFWHSNTIYKVMSQASVTSRFGRHIRISMNSEAIIFAGGHSEWRMAWEDVDGLAKGRTAITVVTGGVGLLVPIAAFDTPEVAQSAYRDMSNWHKRSNGQATS